MNVKSPNNASKWQMGFNSAFKGLSFLLTLTCAPRVCFESRVSGMHKSSKILGARKVTWSKFLEPTNVRLHRTKFSLDGALAPRICSPLRMSDLSVAAVAYTRLKTTHTSGWLSCYIEKVVIGDFRTAALLRPLSGGYNIVECSHRWSRGRGTVSKPRFEDMVFNVVAVTSSTSTRRGGYARQGSDTAVWQDGREQQLHPYRQKFSVGPVEYTRLQKLA
jgi:hypothetical protein